MAATRVLQMKTSTSATPVRLSNTTSQVLQKELASLRRYLPLESLSFFQVRRYGRNVGCNILCDICGARPPKLDHKSNYGYVRWRWLTAHMRKEHV